MSLNPKKLPKTGSKKAGPVPPADSHRAVLIQVIGLGLQPGGEWQGEKKPDKVKVRLTYELVDVRHEFDGEEKPLIISEEIALSGHEKSVCMTRLNTLDPMDVTKGDLVKLLGKPCLVTVSHKVGKGAHAGKVFANVASVAALPKIIPAPKPEEIFNPLVSYDPDSPNIDVFETLPQFIQEKINNRLDAPHNRQKVDSFEEPEMAFDDELPPFDTPDTGEDW